MDGRRSRYRFPDMPPEQSVEHVTERWKERLQGTLGYSSQVAILQVETCIRITLRCVEVDRTRRPNVTDIINKLKILEPEMIKKMSLAFDQSDDDLTGQRSPHLEPVSATTPSSSSTNFSLPDMQSYKEFFPQTFGEDSSVEDIREELKMLECILVGSKEPINLKLPTLKFITKKFSHDLKIGNGGCAEVYKGILGNRIIAVKKLFSIRTIEDKMFCQEVESLMPVNHKNVVRFLGYCSHTEERALRNGEGKYVMAAARERLFCFEYMSNGSLENYLTDEFRGLEWLRRYQIIKGICDGLLHLHREHHIIHMDLKPANILLDNNMVPKITDFGLSRFDDRSQTMSSDRLLSLGYCAPEYQFHGKMSAKSDIYSLGAIIQELVTGSREKIENAKKQKKYKDMPPTAIDLFKECHCSSKAGFTETVKDVIANMESIIADPVQEGQSSKTSIEVISQVMPRSKFLQNIGLESSAPKRSGKTVVSARVEELEAQLEVEKQCSLNLRGTLDSLMQKVDESEVGRVKQLEEFENLKNSHNETTALIRRLIGLNIPSSSQP